MKLPIDYIKSYYAQINLNKAFKDGKLFSFKIKFRKKNSKEPIIKNELYEKYLDEYISLIMEKHNYHYEKAKTYCITKIEAMKTINTNFIITVAVSGGFDPIHIGHLELFRQSKNLGHRLIVILNSDRFLLEKKGYVFMPFNERKKILESIDSIDEVVECIDEDNTVRKTLKKVRPDIFANGGDRVDDNIPEKETCNKLGIKMCFGIGGFDKQQSSSNLIKDVVRKINSASISVDN